MWCMRLKLIWVMSTIGTTNTPSFIKIREVTLQFLGDLTWNDPIVIINSAIEFVNTVEPVYNGHLGTRYIWPLYTGGCYRENLYTVVSSILVAMAVINE